MDRQWLRASAREMPRGHRGRICPVLRERARQRARTARDEQRRGRQGLPAVRRRTGRKGGYRRESPMVESAGRSADTLDGLPTPFPLVAPFTGAAAPGAYPCGVVSSRTPACRESDPFRTAPRPYLSRIGHGPSRSRRVHDGRPVAPRACVLPLQWTAWHGSCLMAVRSRPMSIGIGRESVNPGPRPPPRGVQRVSVRPADSACGGR